VKSTDCTGRPNVSRTLSTLTKELGHHDVWETSSGRTGYTHYTHACDSRIDRIYTMEVITKPKQGAETIATAFTDHLAMTVRVTYDVPCITRKYWTWRLNSVLREDTDFREKLKEQRSKWRKAKRFYPNSLELWDRYVKRMIERNFQREGTERNKGRNEFENFYYAVMYQAIRNSTNHQNMARILKVMKPKIIRLNGINKKGILMDTVEKYMILQFTNI
jgi:hypothetical protein